MHNMITNSTLRNIYILVHIYILIGTYISINVLVYICVVVYISRKPVLCKFLTKKDLT